MIPNLKVKILKKSKSAIYPEHIIVERKSTHELVHLYFDNGNLARLTHIMRDPQIKMRWDDKEKRYEQTYHYIICQDITYGMDNRKNCIKNNRIKNQNFIGIFNSSKWDTSSISFKSHPNGIFNFFVDLDLEGRCTPNSYLRDYDAADVKEVYPHQKRKTASSSQLIVQRSTLTR